MAELRVQQLLLQYVLHYTTEGSAKEICVGPNMWQNTKLYSINSDFKNVPEFTSIIHGFSGFQSPAISIWKTREKHIKSKTTERLEI